MRDGGRCRQKVKQPRPTWTGPTSETVGILFVTRAREQLSPILSHYGASFCAHLRILAARQASWISWVEAPLALQRPHPSPLLTHLSANLHHHLAWKQQGGDVCATDQVLSTTASPQRGRAAAELGAVTPETRVEYASGGMVSVAKVFGLDYEI